VKACGDELLQATPDIVVTWNAYGTKYRFAKEFVRRGASHAVMETGQFSGMWYLGFDGFNGRGRWNLPSVDMADRWRSFGMEIKPWRPGRHILVCGQRGGRYSDMSMPVSWPDDVIGRLRQVTNRPIVYRPHPVRQRYLKGDHADVKTVEPEGRPIDLDLENAHAVVVYTSSVATRAVMQGIPAFYEGPALAAAPCAHRFIDQIDDPVFGNGFSADGVDARSLLFETMAWCHWRPEEIEDGTAWRWLTREKI
jgi:hypothetical protein